MMLVRVTAARERQKLTVSSRQVLGEASDDPRYWDRVCDVILRRMERDGIISSAEEGGTTVGTGDGLPDHERSGRQARAPRQAGDEVLPCSAEV